MNGDKKIQREVADVAGITETAIRNGYAQMIEDKNIEELKWNNQNKKKENAQCAIAKD